MIAIKAQNTNLISRSATNGLKIFFELLVLIHHLYQPESELLKAINAIIGPVGVAGFFMLSGYGVGISIMNKGEGYLRSLTTKRIPKMYLIILLTDIFYLILFYMTGNEFKSFIGFISSVLYLPVFKDYVALSHWLYFVADLMLYYVVFVVIMYIIKRKMGVERALPKAALAMLIIQLALITVLTVINVKTGSHRYLRACLMFPLGIVVAYYGKSIYAYVKKYKYAIAGYSFLLATLFFQFLSYDVFSEYVTCGLFAIAVIALIVGVEFEIKEIDIVSKHIIFIYLSHEFFAKMLWHFVPGWNNLLTIEVTVLYAIVFAVFAFKTKGVIGKKRPAPFKFITRK